MQFEQLIKERIQQEHIVSGKLPQNSEKDIALAANNLESHLFHHSKVFGMLLSCSRRMGSRVFDMMARCTGKQGSESEARFGAAYGIGKGVELALQHDRSMASR